jgi:hypothetical protein
VNCLEVREQLSGWVDETPRCPLPAALQAHVAACPECRQAKDDYLRLDDELNQIYAIERKPDFAAQIVARIKSPMSPMSVMPLPAALPRRRFRLFTAAAAAAVVAIGAFVGWAYFSARSSGEKEHLAGVEMPPPTARRLPVPADLPMEFKLEGAVVWVKGGSEVWEMAARHAAVKTGAAVFQVEKGAGTFLVDVPGGSIAVLGTEFSIRVDPENVRVSLREGSVRLAGAGKSATLQPGQTAVLTKDLEDGPTLIAGVVYAAETIWRPWSALVEAEQSERMAYLKDELSQEDYDVRLAARKYLAEAGEDGLHTAREWTKSSVPRLRLEAVLFLRRAPQGCPKSIEALHQVQKNSKEQPSIRRQAEESLRVLGEVLNK